MDTLVANTVSPSEKEFAEINLRGSGGCGSCVGCAFGIKLRKGRTYMIQAENGEEYAQALFDSRSPDQTKLKADGAMTVLRELTPEDQAKLKDRQKREMNTQNQIREKVREMELKMRVSSVEFNNDESIIYCYYTAPERVDFRELIKDLGHTFKKRIEMRQIGARDEARMLGGHGHCGQQLCCHGTFRTNQLPSVNIKMARIQKLSTNPQNLLGLCGKLRCCLAFEYKDYLEGPDDAPVPKGLLDLANQSN